MSLQGRVAVVTGGARGIGEGIALCMAEAGAKVVLASRTVEEIDYMPGIYLTRFYNSRIIDNPDVDYLMADIAAVEEMRDRKSISLNLEQRTADREENRGKRLDRENQRRVASGLDPVESLRAE